MSERGMGIPNAGSSEAFDVDMFLKLCAHWHGYNFITKAHQWIMKGKIGNLYGFFLDRTLMFS
jgi:hypothetical protein